MQKPIIKLQILDYILDNPGVSILEIAKALNLNTENIRVHINKFPKLKHIKIFSEIDENVKRFYVEIV